MKKKSASASRGVIAAVSTLLAVAIGVTSGAASYRSLICSAIGGDMYKKMRPIRTMNYKRADRTAPGHTQDIHYIASLAL